MSHTWTKRNVPNYREVVLTATRYEEFLQDILKISDTRNLVDNLQR